jgi:hypothetical protein
VSERGNMLKTLSIISVQMVGPPLFSEQFSVADYDQAVLFLSDVR